MEGCLYERGRKQLEYKRGKRTGAVSREPKGSTEVLVVIVDLQVSAKVVSSDLATRQDMTLEARVVVCGRNLAIFR